MLGSALFFPATALLAEDATEQKTATLEDFSKDDMLDWRVVDDGVMGGLSKGKLSIPKDGTAKFEGTLSLENNGGFSSIRTAKMGPLDLSKHSGLAIRVKGDGRTYQLRLESDARYRGSWAVSFKADFQTKDGEWTVVEVPFSAFEGGWRGRDLPDATLNPAKIERMGVILADKNPGSFALEIDWIKPIGGGEN